MENNTSEIIKSIADITYNRLIQKRQMNYSLLGGDLGEIAFLYYYSRLNHQYQQFGDDCLKKLLSDFSSCSHIPTYCNGVAGLGMGLLSLEIDGFVTGCNKALDNIDIYLSKQSKYYISLGELDFLHGFIGFGFYFLERFASSPDFAFKELFRIVKYLSTNSIRTNNYIKWRYREKKLVKPFNIALSHGMSSIIIFLSRIIREIPNITNDFRNVILELINGSIMYLMENRVSRENLSCYFVSTSRECEPIPARSRLAWCYGDLGVLYAIYEGSTLIDENNLQRFAIEALEWTAINRRNLRQNYVNDACICHGSSGIYLFFRYIANKIKSESLSSTSKYWKQVTLNLVKRISDSYTFLTYDPSSVNCYVEKSGLLEGAAGIAMSLLDIETPLHKWLLL